MGPGGPYGAGAHHDGAAVGMYGGRYGAGAHHNGLYGVIWGHYGNMEPYRAI